MQKLGLIVVFCPPKIPFPVFHSPHQIHCPPFFPPPLPLSNHPVWFGLVWFGSSFKPEVSACVHGLSCVSRSKKISPHPDCLSFLSFPLSQVLDLLLVLCVFARFRSERSAIASWCWIFGVLDLLNRLLIRVSEMNHTSADSDDGMFLSDQIGSPSVEKGNSSGSVDGGTVLKKGPWTSAEDAILVEYVKKHGEGNWNAVQKYSGLSRCGKSCRLRWANHLRPNLKKGAFSAKEERLIVELHAKMGNKWARMAAHLPGRTDNEIKNYWNTRIKRRQRAGLPLYPAELSMHMLQDGHQAQNPFGISNGYKVCLNSVQNGPYEVSDVVFDSLRANSSIFPYVPEVSEISGSDMLMKGFGSPHYNFSPSTLPRQKRTRESASLYHGYASTTDDAFSTLLAFKDGISEKITRSLPYSLPTDHDPTDLDPLSFDVVQGSHALINSSASVPAPEAMKLELPSLQYTEIDLSSWDTSSSPPTLLESVDNFIQSPARTGKADPDSLSPHNSGLLDALVHEAKIISSGKNHSYDKCSAASASSTMTPGDMSSSCPDMYKSEWEEYGDPISPLGHSATSAFKECTPLNASGSSLDKHPPDAYSVCKVKPEPLWQAQPQQKEQEIAPHCDPTRPDALLASDWMGLGAAYYKDQAPITDTIALLLGDDLCNEYKQSAGIADLGWGFSSCTWNNMPAGCNMSDIP